MCLLDVDIWRPEQNARQLTDDIFKYTLHCRHNGRNGVSNHQPHHCLLNRLSRRLSKKTSNLRVTGLCAGNSPLTGEFPAQMASDAENVSIWWLHQDFYEQYSHILLQILLRFFPKCPVVNKSTLDQVTACRLHCSARYMPLHHNEFIGLHDL